MTKIATVSFETEKVDPPEGVSLAGYAVSLMLAGVLVGAPTIVSDKSTPVALTITEPGTYTVQVARISTNGDAMWPPKSSAPFDVPADKVEVPLTVTVSLGDLA